MVQRKQLQDQSHQMVEMLETDGVAEIHFLSPSHLRKTWVFLQAFPQDWNRRLVHSNTDRRLNTWNRLDIRFSRIFLSSLTRPRCFFFRLLLKPQQDKKHSGMLDTWLLKDWFYYSVHLYSIKHLLTPWPSKHHQTQQSACFWRAGHFCQQVFKYVIIHGVLLSKSWTRCACS